MRSLKPIPTLSSTRDHWHFMWLIPENSIPVQSRCSYMSDTPGGRKNLLSKFHADWNKTNSNYLNEFWKVELNITGDPCNLILKIRQKPRGLESLHKLHGPCHWLLSQSARTPSSSVGFSLCSGPALPAWHCHVQIVQCSSGGKQKSKWNQQVNR